MGLTVIGEGVEDENTLRVLRNQGCDEAQGYHLARPLAPDALAAWIAARSRPGGHDGGGG
jgi:EAL domain-containing protein (putative c-di-GMP-specific phosphodiesterase class I)